MDAATQRVHGWIDKKRDDMVEFLQELIRIPSVTGNEGPIQDYLYAYLSDMGLSVDRFVPDMAVLKAHPGFVPVDVEDYEGRPNVVAVYKGKGGGRSLLMNGHVDVIPEGALDNWAQDPWSGTRKDGRVFGRGASDMKSGVAAMAMALRAVIDCGVRLRGDVILEFVMDEELSGNGTLACVIKGYKADAGICCETSGMRVQPGSIGRIWFTIHVKGKAAGIQRRYDGVNAIDMGYIVHKAVAAYEEKRLKAISHPLYPDIQGAIPCMTGRFESGTYNSAFPDSCVLKGSLATVPGEDSDEVKREFAAFVRDYAAAADAWFEEQPPRVVFEGYFAEPSQIPIESPIVQQLVRSYEYTLGEKPAISGREGAADIRFLNRYGDTPTVIFGPGMTEQMHANNEWVVVDDYINSIKILASTIMDWCGAE